MLFDTPVYFVFLVLVVTIYWRLNRTWQNRFLLAASYFFYGWWDWRFLFLIAASTVVDFNVAKKIAASETRRHRQLWLWASLVMNFGFLGYFKYCNFFVESFSSFVALLGFHNIPHGLLNVILPPAISFYTFQEVAYIVDVYHKRLQPADSLADYALFIALFPHLIAGPIQRPSHLLPQVQQKRHYDPGRFLDGCMLIVCGLFRKCVIADQCAELANAAFAGHLGTNSMATLLGVYAFAFQIYGDFSAYSDFARGSAQLMGFHFMVNFRQPYLATSLQEFWRRWHISLSTWLRDYLYIPLGGSRLGEVRTYRNLLVTMLLGGLWHGANWTFVIWGALHGGALAFERFFGVGEPPKTFMARWCKRILVFNLVCLAWIFFRAESLGAALRFIAGLGSFEWIPGFGTAWLVLIVFGSISLAYDLILENSRGEYVGDRMPLRGRIALATTALFLVATFAAGQSHAFIYFQF